jgi:hypothetical protein
MPKKWNFKYINISTFVTKVGGQLKQTNVFGGFLQ